ncbi:terpene synthase-like [Bicyclus anynana]|uniref:Terpene synthase-like n=1 Tax=Bicyclus anynana TaxID=110368 RepID=A0A6J1MP86_BICAN|nr:terpene synthase-like [Bicyclus anynana]
MTEEHSNFYMEKELLSPYHHIQQVKGKQMRIKIILAFNHWLQVPEDKLQYSLEVFNLLHNGGLLIDDIQDDSVVRRGMPAAHCVYGLPLTINASLHVFLLAMDKLYHMNPKAGKICSEHYLDVIRGQGLELYWRDKFVCPTEEEYEDMVHRKTGAAFLMVVRTLQLFSENKTDYAEFIRILGKYYQIRDDYCNLTQQEALEEWPNAEDTDAKEACFCEDLTEGKFSLPIIHSLKTKEGGQILSILRQRTRDDEVKRRCVSLLEKAGSLEYTRQVLRDLDRAARAELSRLNGNPLMEAVLNDLLSWQDQKKSRECSG